MYRTAASSFAELRGIRREMMKGRLHHGYITPEHPLPCKSPVQYPRRNLGYLDPANEQRETRKLTPALIPSENAKRSARDPEIRATCTMYATYVEKREHSKGVDGRRFKVEMWRLRMQASE
ncbi:hypothetical protein MJO28_007007 [Puccinia striiformis f. sp. tritici]